MSTQGTISLSVGMSAGRVSELHTRRCYVPDNAEAAFSDRNVHIFDPRDDDGNIIPYRDQINEIFRPAIERYNAKQKRKSRRKDYDYYSELTREGSQITPIYSYVIQLGNRDNCGTCDADFDFEEYKRLAPNERAKYALEHANNSATYHAAVRILTRVGQEWEQRYPCLKPVSIVLHADEVYGTCHLTVDVVPVASGYKRGMDTRCGMTKALEQMGFKNFDKHNTEAYGIVEFQNNVKRWIAEELMPEEGLERQYMGNTERHRDVAEFKLWRKQHEAQDALNHTQAQLRKAKQENEALELTITGKQQKCEELDKVIEEQENTVRSLSMQRGQLEHENYMLWQKREMDDEKAEQERQEYRDEVERLRKEAEELRAELADAGRLVQMITRPIMAFVDFVCDHMRPASRDSFRSKITRYVNAYEKQAGDVVNEFTTKYGREEQDVKVPPTFAR